jgi:hypothetical protein
LFQLFSAHTKFSTSIPGLPGRTTHRCNDGNKRRVLNALDLLVQRRSTDRRTSFGGFGEYRSSLHQ